jgi:general secretion pathway protein C
VPLRERATTPRKWAMAVAGALALSAVLVWFLRGGEGDMPPADLPAPAMSTATMAPPPPAPFVMAAPMAAVTTSADLKLRGLIVRPGAPASAIIETTNGQQRLVRAGSMISPGVTVEAIDPTGVIIASGDSRQRLALGDATPQTESPPAAAAVPLKALAATANDYRLALKPRKVGDRTTGYTLVDPARLPAFRLAGMLPGDVLISVNGSGIQSEEKLLEMPAEIAGAYAVDVVFEREGQQRRAVVKIER